MNSSLNLVEALVGDLGALGDGEIPKRCFFICLLFIYGWHGWHWQYMIKILGESCLPNHLKCKHLSDGPSLASCQSPWSVICGQSERESSRSWGQLTDIAFTPTSERECDEVLLRI